jgi:pimeloyl-ACP methyl ester carboxylesterase
MKTFILVHGAWHGGWVWVRTAKLLRQGGHEVFTPSLTGLGDRSHLLSPSITLSAHVRDVTNLIESYDLHDAILCGHSYAGLVVAQAADQMPDRVAGVVFIDSFLPEDGMALLDLLPPPFRAEIDLASLPIRVREPFGPTHASRSQQMSPRPAATRPRIVSSLRCGPRNILVAKSLCEFAAQEIEFGIRDRIRAAMARSAFI